jgi:hypothetical protein
MGEDGQGMNRLCPCCGNPKGCDCYSAQSPQYRDIADLRRQLEKAKAAAVSWCNTATDRGVKLAQAERERDGLRGVEHELLTAQGEIDIYKQELADLHRQLAEARAALETIATQHQNYSDGPFETDTDSVYSIGVTDGHRCAAKLARAALSALDQPAKSHKPIGQDFDVELYADDLPDERPKPEGDKG